jgi:autotransporter-associated beta strand protein
VTLATPFAGGPLAASVTKVGGGVLTFAADTDYSGPTSVQAGTLRIDAASLGTGDVTVADGGTLGGSGTVGGATTLLAGATLAPGASPGTLSFASDLILQGGGNYNWQISDAAGEPGSGWDLLAVTGMLDIAASSADPFQVNLWSLSGTDPDVSGDALNFSSTQSSTWTIASAAGGITGFSSDAFVINTTAFNGTDGFSNPLGGGRLDLGAGEVAVASGGITAEDLRADIVAGRNGGAWDGSTGIMSSAAAGSGGTRAVGYVVAADGSAKVSFAAPGDTDLNGQVNVFDLIGIDSAGKFGNGQPAVWNQGDFNYDGVANVFDLIGIDSSGAYGTGPYFPAGPTVAGGLGQVAAVPEPTGFIWGGGITLLLAGRLLRKRRGRSGQEAGPGVSGPAG